MNHWSDDLFDSTRIEVAEAPIREQNAFVEWHRPFGPAQKPSSEPPLKSICVANHGRECDELRLDSGTTPHAQKREDKLQIGPAAFSRHDLDLRQNDGAHLVDSVG